MTTIKLRTKIMFALLSVIFFLGVSMSVLGFFVMKKNVYQRAQEQVSKDLEIVRQRCYQEIESMKLAFNMITEKNDLGLLREYLALDYLCWISRDKIQESDSEIVQKVYKTAQDSGASRIVSKDEIEKLIVNFESLNLKDTPKARPTDKKVLNEAMVLEYAKPFIAADGTVEKILVGGKLVNQNDRLIDSIVNTVFERKLYKGKPVGTITIFQDDVRIATNVMDHGGRRALGTRVSEVVYNRVFEEHDQWFDRAFVVTDWYFTAYEPIKSITGKVIGIIYVGVLEKPFVELQQKLFVALLVIIMAGCVISIVFSVFISKSIADPLTEVIKGTDQISHGNLDVRMKMDTDIYELNELLGAVNEMAIMLAHREEILDISKKKMEVLNRSYLDLIGFVSHELKGILSSIILNVYLIKKKILGSINDKQEKTLNSIARNLDYLAVTVKNFLNLSRIEKNELEITKTELHLKEHIFDVAIESFDQPLKDKGMTMDNRIETNLMVHADSALLQIVANNLISNAIKYGKDGSTIIITSKNEEGYVEIEVYNDGEPICGVDIDKLFKKFSRVVYRGMESIKGSGIGLYITKEIIKMHGGSIKVEPREKGNSFIFQIDKN